MFVCSQVNVNILGSQSLYTENELFALIADGNEDAFKEFYARFLPDITAYIFTIVKSREAVNEILQEALVRFWLNRDKLPDVQFPKTWFSRIVLNECYRFLRKHGLQQRLQAALQEQSHHGESMLHQTEMDVSYRETQRIIRQTVAGLSQRQRTIYHMSREDGLKLKEIAQELDVSTDYVKKTLMVALQKIRQKLLAAGRFLLILMLLLPR